MRTFSWIVLVALLLTSLSFAQTTFVLPISTLGPIQTGFVVITPTSGTGQGLIVSEIFGLQSGNNFFQSSVPPSPLVTNTSVVVSTDPFGLNTGIALVNPNSVAGTVTLTLRDQMGTTVAIVTINLGARQQISRFVTEIFVGQPVFVVPFVGQVFIDSSISIGVLGLQFNGPSFTSLPVAGQLATPLPTAFLVFTNTFPNGNQLFSASPLGAATPMPVVTAGVGGASAQLLPQFATGGGWATQVTIANTSVAAQTVRVDFFNSEGNSLSLPSSSHTQLLVLPGGVAVLSAQF